MLLQFFAFLRCVLDDYLPTSVVNPKLFFSDPYPDPTSQAISDSAPDPDPT